MLNKYKCFILGEEPIALRCAELLHARGHRILGVVTRAAPFKRWAQELGIPVLAKSEYADFLADKPLDLLFSITHPNIISEATIASARVAAINYHDGPLPRYAGMNGSAWALHNGETRHAVVWHHLTSGLDEGAIIARSDLELDPRETSVSLNMRNSATALESFATVLEQIETGSLMATPQDTSIARSIFSRHDRPATFTTMNWNQPAAALDALIRACDFGPFDNAFGMAKLLHQGRAVSVLEASVVDAVAAGPAGTLLSITAEGILVRCAQGALLLRRCASLSGAPLAPLEAAQYLALRVGDGLQNLAPLSGPEAQQASQDVARAEPHWLASLSDRTIPNLPFETQSAQAPCQVALQLAPEFVQAFQAHWLDAQMALFACTLAGMMRQDSFHVGWVDGVQRGSALYRDWTPLLLPSVPLLAQVDPGRGFDTLVEQTGSRRTAIGARAPALLDLVARHPALHKQGDLAEGAVSPVAIVLQNGAEAIDAGTSPQALPGCRLMLVLDATGSSPCYLASAGALSPQALQTIADHMQIVAAKLALDRNRPLGTIDLLNDASRHRQIVEWNATDRPFPDTLRIHDLFEQQVALQPDATALLCDGASLSYAEVEQRANRMANLLISHGAAPGSYVAVMVERSFELVTTLIAVAKTGAAYLPIDPVYPPERVSFMLEDAACKIMVVSDEFRAQAAGIATVLSPTAEQLNSCSTDRPLCPATASEVCYTIYTSGSTGNPKGVVLTHRAVVNTLDWVNRNFGVGPSDRLLFVTSPSFDLSVYDMFGGLGAGATVEIASSTLLQNPAALAQKLVDGGITIWDSAPPALARLASFLPEQAPASALRLVMLSGDWIPLWLAADLPRIFPGVAVKSLGGATEAAIWSNYYHVQEVSPAWASIPYGYPIQNSRYYILDTYLRPMPPMMPGDLYIAGQCLADGYLNRVELTAERFVPDPFHPGQRMYKTGDLAKYWTDGTMEFLGRVDFQVKVRGYRVELGEVETALRALPGVRDAICTTWVDGSQQNTLVSYVIGATGATLNSADIKAALAEGLPHFMVPSFVIVLPELPLSGNGKLDRKALPTPDQTSSGSSYLAPSTPLQEQLAGIWQEVLKRKSIGVRDNFFELGGHSLLVVNLIQRLKSQLGISIPLSRIIEHPTIEQLARTLDVAATQAPASDSLLVELKAGGSKNLFFVHDGEGETLLYRSLAQMLPAHYSVYGVMPRSLPHIPLADLTIEDMARTYLKHIRARQPHGPYLLAGLCAGGVIAFEMSAQLKALGERTERVFIMDAIEPQAKPRSFGTSKRRLNRLLDGLAAPAGAPAPLRVAKGLGTALRKAWNLTRYEASNTLQRAYTRYRLRLLWRVVTQARPWPSYVTGLGVREIYMSARARYAPAPLTDGSYVIMKAGEGADADEPAIYQIEDPALGWGRVVKSELLVVDVNGGHSSMLQTPHVGCLAQQFIDLIEAAPAPAAAVAEH